MKLKKTPIKKESLDERILTYRGEEERSFGEENRLTNKNETSEQSDIRTMFRLRHQN